MCVPRSTRLCAFPNGLFSPGILLTVDTEIAATTPIIQNNTTTSSELVCLTLRVVKEIDHGMLCYEEMWIFACDEDGEKREM